MTLPPFTTLDWVLLAVTAYTGLRGAFRGLFREMLGVGTVAGAYLLTNLLQPVAAPGIARMFDNPAVGAVGAYGTVFVGCVLALNLVVGILTRLSSDSQPSSLLNGVGGAVLGGVKGLLVVAVILFLVRALPNGKAHIKGSLVAPHLAPLTDLLGDRLMGHLPNVRISPPA
ncbi:MAG: CvpA family protein [Nitrospirae bacterium]|nr:CvpA family protein [Nitrospirota bacterium]